MAHIELSYGEKGNLEQVQVNGKSILEYTLSHPDYLKLSSGLREQIETKKEEIIPVIAVEVEISGWNWIPYRPATWEDPAEGGYYDNWEMDGFTITGDSSMVDAFTTFYSLGGGDDAVLNKMFSGKKLIPIYSESGKDFFEDVSIDQKGEFDVNLKDDVEDYLPEDEVDSKLIKDHEYEVEDDREDYYEYDR